MDNNTIYTILLRYFKTLSYTGYVLLQDLLYLIVLLYIKELPYITLLQEQKAIINKAILIILSRCTFCLNSCEIKDITPPSYENVDYNIDFFNINLSRDSILLTIALGENLKSVTIPYVTLLTAGVASTSDKVVIDKANVVINEEPIVGGLLVKTLNNDVSINYNYIEEGTSKVLDKITLPIATQSTAGLLSKEDKLRLDLVTGDIAEAEISGFTKELSPNKVTLKLESANKILSLDLNRASALGAGVVSSSDIDVIDKFKNLFYYKPLVDDLEVTPTLNTVEITYQYFNPNDYSVYSDDIIIPYATAEKAGVMSSSDKTVVDKANSLINSHPLVDKLSFAISNNKRYLLYTLNGNSTSTGIEVPLFGETLQVLADKTLTGSESCYILLYGSNVSGDPISSIELPRVNEFHDGVLSSAKYLEFNTAVSSIEGIYSSINGLNNTVVTTVDIGYNSDSVDVNLLTQNSNPIESNIEAATITKAGVMSAEDKLLLTNVVSEMPTISDNIDAIAGALPKVTDTFEGAAQDTGLRYVIRKNKLIAILKDGRVQYAPEGLAYVDAIAPTSFVYGTKTYEVPAGESYVELGQSALTQVGAILRNNAGIRAFGLYSDTSKNTSLQYVFASAADLEWLDVSAMDTSAVTLADYLFSGSAKLREIMGKLDLSKALLINNCFSGCTALERVDIPTITAACTSMARTFYYCKSLSALDISSWDLSKVTTIREFCRGCSALKTIVLPTASNPVLTNINHLLAETGLESVDINDFDVSAVTEMSSAFSVCPNLREVIIPNWHAPNLTNPAGLFAYNANLERVDISGLTMDKVTNVTYMFLRNYALTSLKFPNMGQLKADTDNNKAISLRDSPLDRASLDSIFAYDRTANGLENTLTVQLSKTSKALLSAEDIAAITAKGYTIT